MIGVSRMTWQIALSKTNRIVHSMLSRLILAKQLQPQPDLQAAGLLYRLTMGCISDDLCSWSGQSSPCSSSQPSYIAVRGMATKKAGGTARQKPDTPGRNLGTKFCHNELVFPGQIIVRQRGTKWHAGDNVGLGRDHTIFSKAVGRVRFTTEPGPRDQERTVVSVDAIGTAEEQAVMVARRSQIKRELMQGLTGRAAPEAALYFPLRATGAARTGAQ